MTLPAPAARRPSAALLWVLLAAMGAKTETIELGTGVIDMRYENPLYMAEEAAAAAAAAQESVGEARQEGAEVSDDAVVVEAPTEEPLDDIAPAAGRMGKLRGRLSRSQNAIGQGLLGILTAGDLDEDAVGGGLGSMDD